MKSIFENNFAGFPEYPSLQQNIEIDVAVVGGGIAGLLTAYHLAEAGLKPAVFEAEKICSGTTAKSTAVVTALQGLHYDRMQKKAARGKDGEFLSSQIDALNMYRDILKKHEIDCDYRTIPAYLYADCTEEEKKLVKEFGAMSITGASAELVDTKYGKAIKMENQGEFNVLKFLQGIPKNFDIYENTRVTDFFVKNKTLVTASGHKIKADKIVVATRFPAILDGAFYFKMYQTKSYVMTFKHEPVDGSYNGSKDNSLYFRDYGGRVVLGGFDHRAGKGKCTDYYKKLADSAQKIFGAGAGSFGDFWSAEDAVTFDGIPFAGRVTKKKKHKDVYVITGFNEWGMANAMICSRVVANQIAGMPEKHKDLFCPSRAYVTKNLGKFLRHALVVAGGLLRGVWKGKHACRHLHCGLKWNASDGVWECPCHGSRYAKNGALLDGPSVENLKK